MTRFVSSFEEDGRSVMEAERKVANRESVKGSGDEER